MVSEGSSGHLVDLQPLDEQRLHEFLSPAPVLSAADISNRATEHANHRQTPVAQILTQLRTGREELARKLDALTEEEKEFLTARRNSVESCKADWRNGSKQLARRQCASRGCRAYNRFPTPAYLTGAIGLRAEVHWSTAMTANPAVREQRVTPNSKQKGPRANHLCYRL